MLHEMNPQGRFSSRAENYAKYRPSYPDEVINFLLSELNISSKPIIADIGLYGYTHVADEGGFDLNQYPAIQA